MEQVGFKAEFYSDGRVVGRTDAGAVIIGPGHRMECAGATGERPCKLEVGIAPSGPHDALLGELCVAFSRGEIARL